MDKKITIVFPVMNRNSHVAEAVPTWMEHDEIDEIIIVDWSSDQPIHLDESCQKICKNSKVKIIRIENEKYFQNPAFAINIGIDMSDNSNILKLDIDYKLTNPNILKILKRNSTPGHFFCGTVPEKEFNCFWGFAYFHRQDYEKTGGYNENLQGWGGEDADFYDRLEEVGAERTVVINIKDFISHIDHDDNLRTQNHFIKDLNYSNKINGQISKSKIKIAKSKYNLLKAESNTVFLSRVV